MDQQFSGFNYNAIAEALDKQTEINETLETNKHVVDNTYWESLGKSCITKGKMDYLQSNIDFSITLMYNKVQTTSYLDQQHTQFDKKTEAMKEHLEELNLHSRNLVDNYIVGENEMCDKLRNLSINFQSENMVQETENISMSIDYKKKVIEEAQAKLLFLKNQEDDRLDQEAMDNLKTVMKQCFEETLKRGDSNKIAARLDEVNKNLEYLKKKIATLEYKIQ